MIRLPAALAMAGLDADMLLQVHDELIFEVPDDQVETVLPIITSVMEAAVDPVLKLAVPLVAEAGVSDSWAGAH
jgi:DNA polymerase-1